MKKRKTLIIIIAVSAVVLITTIVLMGVFLHSDSPEKAVEDFHNSVLPDYNAKELEVSIGSKPYSIRFDDGGYFADRYSRAREQIVYYYGEGFSSSLSDLVVYDVSDSESTIIKREYMSKYSIEIDEIKRVDFSVTLSSDYGEKTRDQSMITLKINGDWVVYDYDAYWFAYM